MFIKTLTISTFFLSTFSVWAQTSVNQPNSKVGVNVRTPTETLDIKGTLRVQELPRHNSPSSISTHPDGSASDSKNQTFVSKFIVVANDQGVFGQANGVQSSFFYMPAMVLPVDPAATHPNVSYAAADKTFKVDLYGEYVAQFRQINGVSSSSSATSAVLPVLQVHDLDFIVTYYDPQVFQNVTVTPTGEMTYQVKDGAVLTERSFFNVVFKVK